MFMAPLVLWDPALGIHFCVTDRAKCLCAAGTLHLKSVLSGGLTCKFREVKAMSCPQSHSSEEQRIPVSPWFWVRPEEGGFCWSPSAAVLEVLLERCCLGGVCEQKCSAGSEPAFCSSLEGLMEKMMSGSRLTHKAPGSHLAVPLCSFGCLLGTLT